MEARRWGMSECKGGFWLVGTERREGPGRVSYADEGVGQDDADQ